MQQVLRSVALAFRNKREVIVRDVTRGGHKRFLAVMPYDCLSVSLDISVLIRCITEQQQVLGCSDLAHALVCSISEHHHQHFYGGRI